MIIYNPDIHPVIKTIQILNKDLDVEFIEDEEEKNLTHSLTELG